MPTLGSLLLERSSDEELLVFLARIIGDPEELNSVGFSGGSRQAPDGCAKLGVRFRSPAEVPGIGSIVKGAAGNIVSGVEAGKVRKIVELLIASAQDSFLPIGPEIPAINRVSDLGQRRDAARSSHAHDTGERIGPVQSAIRSAQHFDLIDSSSGKYAKIDRAAYVVGGDAINEDFVRITVAAAHEQLAQPAALSGLRDLRPRHQPQSLVHVQFVGVVVFGKQSDRCAYLSLRRWRARRRNGDGLGHYPDSQKQINIGVRAFPNIERLTRGQIERGSAGLDLVAARGNIVEFVSSFAVRGRRSDNLLIGR